MRKVIIVICLVASLVCLAAPAFADSEGGVGSVFKESSIPFDFITFNDGPHVGDVYSWPFTMTRAWGSQTGSSTVNDAFFWHEAGYRDATNFGTFVPNTCTSFTVGADQVLLTSSVDCYFGEEYDDGYLHIYEVAVSGNLNYVSTYGTRYYAETVPFERRFSPNASCCDIEGYIRDASRHTPVSSKDLPIDFNGDLLISDLRITFSFYWDEYEGNRSWYFRCNTNDMLVNDTQKWFKNLDLRWQVAPDPDDFSIISWLQNVLGGFLDFEFWPGFSINKIFWLVLVIGILLWFITLLI